MDLRQVVSTLLLLYFAHEVSGMIYHTPCNMSDRYGSCPPGSCCARDAFESTDVYCKPISDAGGPCYAASLDWPGSCHCSGNLMCVPNLQVPTWVSKYGTCQNASKIA